MNPLANQETKDAVRNFESFFAQEMTSVSEELRKASQEVRGGDSGLCHKSCLFACGGTCGIKFGLLLPGDI